MKTFQNFDDWEAAERILFQILTRSHVKLAIMCPNHLNSAQPQSVQSFVILFEMSA